MPSPNANAHAERFIRSSKAECLAKVIPFGEHHFRRMLTEIVAHYHGERPHRGLANDIIDGATPIRDEGRIRRRQRLGGLINYYHRAA